MTISNITVLIPFTGSNIDTTTIDGWRQGVEITLWKHFDAGTVKIRSGEIGHRMSVLNFGKDAVNEASHDQIFNDPINRSIPENVINDLSVRQHFLAEREIGNGTTNATAGILEPINKQRKTSIPLDGNSVPLIDPHFVLGEAVLIHSVFELSNKHRLPFLDRNSATFGQRIENFSTSNPNYDESVFDHADPNNSSDLQAALNKMKPDSETYIALNERTGNCGQLEDYYNSTNSISFLGLTY